MVFKFKKNLDKNCNKYFDVTIAYDIFEMNCLELYTMLSLCIHVIISGDDVKRLQEAVRGPIQVHFVGIWKVF